MRGLFFKIFVIFWIAQSLIFVISTALILQHRFPMPHPDVLFDSLSLSLRSEAQETAAAFETGGCAAVQAYAAARRQAIALEDASGRDLCGTAVQPLSKSGALPGRLAGQQIGRQYVWTMSVVSVSGKRYIFLLSLPHAEREHTWYSDLLHFAFPQLPVAIAVGGVTTFALVLIFTRPVIRLRQAARELAHGNLQARVRETAPRSRLFQEDEFHALVHDFNHMAERLESLVSAQQMLLRDVSHELRSPLARLSVALELAREDAAAEMAPHLDRIERETAKLNQLIGQLLTLSSMEAIDSAGRFESVSLLQLIRQMIPDAEFEARQRQCFIAFDAREDCVIPGNRELLYRAIENVLRNAIRFTGSQTEVEIRLEAVQERSGRFAVIEVRDHGPGIPESETDAIFRPFYRIDRARSQETGGSGVGLAITERAVKLHRGEIRAFNRMGGGATIQMRLPSSPIAVAGEKSMR
ncbi:MAG TPA: ATP-binding protein [Terracidiphilus sp.]|nr:ATP-binding protein [Terracidiphilus sp.]